jgi:serine/threonine-protein kinase
VSDGPPPVTVPEVAGLQVDDAVGALAAEGLEVAREDRFNKETPAGTVIRTEPAGGRGAAQGSTVTVFVSKGPEGSVPDVVGLSVEDARAILEEAGYTVEVRGFGELFGEGVVETEPEAGKRLKPGGEVTIWTL